MYTKQFFKYTFNCVFQCYLELKIAPLKRRREWFQLTDSFETKKKTNWFVIIISIAIAGARISHVNKNLTKSRAFKLQVKMKIFGTWNVNAHNFVKFSLTWLILAPAIAVLITIKNQFGFFVSAESVSRKFLTPDNIKKTQLKVYLKNCSVYIISSLINKK